MSSKDKRLITFFFIVLVMAGALVGYAAIPQNTLRQNAGIVMPTVNATAGYYVGANLIIDATTAAALATLDTGQGANELYDMDQNVLTTSNVNFTSLEADNLIVRGNINATQLAMYPQQPASYIIWGDPPAAPTIYYAKSGTDGSITSGTDFDALAQNCIDNGDSLFIGDGEFIITPSGRWGLEVDSNQLIKGMGNATILKLADSSSQTHYGIIGSSKNVKDVVIRDLSIDGNIANQVDGGSDTYQNGIRFYGVNERVKVDSCTVFDITRVAIGFSGGGNYSRHRYLTVKDNVVINGRITGGTIEKSTYQGNTVIGAKSAGALEFFAGTLYCNIVDNIIINSTNDGIQMYTADWSTEHKHNIISRNIIRNSEHIGIYMIRNAEDNKVSENQVYNSSIYAIQLAHCRNNDVTNNIFQKCLSVSTVVLTNVTNIIFDDNRIHPELEPTAYALKLLGAKNCTIANNQVTARTIGIWLTSTGVIHSTYNTIRGNVVGKGMETIAPGRGIKEEDANQDYNIITGNIVHGSNTPIYPQGSNTIVNLNIGWVTENSGNATLAAISSSIVVNHGCDYTPTLGDIQVTPSRDLGNCTYYWIDTIGAAQFTIHVGAAGAPKNIDKVVYFLWSVRRH